MSLPPVLLGVNLPAGAGEDSANILPLLCGRPEAHHPSQGAVVNATGIGFATRQGSWKLVESKHHAKPGGEDDVVQANAISGLYNLAGDPAKEPTSPPTISKLFSSLTVSFRTFPGSFQASDDAS